MGKSPSTLTITRAANASAKPSISICYPKHPKEHQRKQADDERSRGHPYRKENGLLAVRFGIETKEPSPMRIGEAIDEYEKIIFDKGDISSANNIRCMKKAVMAYRGLDTKVVDIDESYCDGLVDFLHKDYTAQFGKISMTTARAFIYLFSSTLNNAVANGIIGVSPLRFVNIHGRITRERPLKKFLTIDEIKALMDTPCPVMSRPQVKQAFMLSIFTYLSLPMSSH